ncbi:MAG: hypothetical protein MAG795_00503 [Candidatus Woesearchaeota archaeon]|nr:hypothetical protein [Candidatus Woesearchaeota archaeon]
MNYIDISRQILIRINFWLILLFFGICFKDLKKVFKKVKKHIWLILLLIFIVSFYLRLFVVPIFHHMFTDEFVYMKAGKEMINGFAKNYPKSMGWPYMISILFRFFGVSNWVALYGSAVFGALTCIGMFFLSYAITRKQGLSLISSAIFTLLPLHLQWSGSAETNVFSVFFIVISLAVMFIYFKIKKRKLLFLCLLLISFTSQIRVENYILFGIFAVGYLLKIKKFPKHLFFGIFVAVLLCTPSLISQIEWYTAYNQIQSDSEGNLTGSNWSIYNLINNTANYGREVFENPCILILSIFAIVGFSSEILGLIYFILFWLVYFCSWMQTLGGRKRVYLTFYPILVIFGLIGIYRLFKRNLLYIFGLIMIAGLLFNLNTIDMDARILETQIIEIIEQDVSNCTIVYSFPEVFATTDLNVISTNALLINENLSADCLVFYEGVACKDWWSDKHYMDCKAVKLKYNMTKYKNYTYKTKTYWLYISSVP